MPAHSTALSRDARETIPDLRRRLGLFSFQQDTPTAESVLRNGSCPDLGLRPGGIVEWLATTPGAGTVAFAMQMMSQLSSARGVIAIVDGAGECFVPALSGWGIHPGQ